jgi:hypothetical protein
MMATNIRQKLPTWFTVLAVVLVLWGLLGCWAFYLHVTLGPAMDPNATDWDRAYYANLPGWFTLVYAAAIGGGLLGSIALLLRSWLALPLYLVSLVAVVVQFGWVFGATDILAQKGAAVTVPFPLFILAVALLQVWLASHARRRGWIA